MYKAVNGFESPLLQVLWRDGSKPASDLRRSLSQVLAGFGLGLGFRAGSVASSMQIGV